MKIQKSREPVSLDERKMAERLGCDWGAGTDEPCEGRMDSWQVPFQGRFVLCARHLTQLVMDELV